LNTEHARRVINFQELKRVVPIIAVLERYGILPELKRIGSQLFGACPIHKGTNRKQFVVDANKNVWRCFGDCDRGGSTIDLVSAIENIETKAAAQLITEWFAVPTSSQRVVQHRNQQRSSAMSGRPTMKAFVVEDKEEGSEEKAFWTRVGSAWPHGDGKGLNVQIASGVSVSGRLVLREYTDDDAKKDEDDKKVSKFKKK
jgi:DNA primase